MTWSELEQLTYTNHSEPSGASPERMTAMMTLLCQVWDARGEADVAAVWTLSERAETSGAPKVWPEDVAETIRALDRTMVGT